MKWNILGNATATTTLDRISLDKIPLALWRITQRWGDVRGCHEPLWWVQVQIGSQTQSPPLFAVDTGFKLDGFEASGCLFSLIKAISLKPLVKFPLQEEQVLVWIEASLAVMAVTTTRLSTFTCWMSQWDWLSHLLSQEQKNYQYSGHVFGNFCRTHMATCETSLDFWLKSQKSSRELSRMREGPLPSLSCE